VWAAWSRPQNQWFRLFPTHHALFQSQAVLDYMGWNRGATDTAAMNALFSGGLVGYAFRMGDGEEDGAALVRRLLGSSVFDQAEASCSLAMQVDTGMQTASLTLGVGAMGALAGRAFLNKFPKGKIFAAAVSKAPYALAATGLTAATAAGVYMGSTCSTVFDGLMN
jgi:hypothetical protein